uniref:Orn/Lys/Arg decarboxylases family 1 pyridoxal-P attachment site domain-containing protein n=1 Tax=Solanum lycopersicum TaxID=4081 RepID=K4CDJ9_SOLLC
MEGRKAAALLVVSPTYHEAHGAHLGFHLELPSSSLSQGTDLAVQSTHNVTCSLTQSSMLHMQGNLVDRERISKSLQMLQSSSPSYFLLASLDASRAQLIENREAVVDKAMDLALEARILIPDEIITEEALNYVLEMRSNGVIITGAAYYSISSFFAAVLGIFWVQKQLHSELSMGNVKQEVGAYSSKGKQDDPIQAGEARETPASYYSLDVISNGNSS